MEVEPAKSPVSACPSPEGEAHAKRADLPGDTKSYVAIRNDSTFEILSTANEL